MWQYICISLFFYIWFDCYIFIKSFNKDRLEYDKYYNE